MTDPNPYAAPAKAPGPPESSTLGLDFRQIALLNVYLYGLCFFITFLHQVSYCLAYSGVLTRTIPDAEDKARFWWYIARVGIYVIASSQTILRASAIVDWLMIQARTTVAGHAAQDAKAADLHAVLVVFIRMMALSYIVYVLDELTYASGYERSIMNMMHLGRPSFEATCYLFRIVSGAVTVVVLYRMAPAIAAMFGRQRGSGAESPDEKPV